jgi:hypothetical protein
MGCVEMKKNGLCVDEEEWGCVDEEEWVVCR